MGSKGIGLLESGALDISLGGLDSDEWNGGCVYGGMAGVLLSVTS